jgi:hypothetical protein
LALGGHPKVTDQCPNEKAIHEGQKRFEIAAKLIE